MSSIKNAKFIKENADFGTAVSVFSKVINIEKAIARATLFCSALGCYEAFINGSRVGDFIFAPGWTTYGKRLQYQEYDVTALMKKENILEIALANGRRFHGSAHENYRSITNKEAALISCLLIEYKDGSSDFIPTDYTWKCRKSHILDANIYNGEVVDFTTDTSEIYSVKELEDVNKEILIPTEGEVTREMMRLDAADMFTTPKGELVIDFGQNITGYVEWLVPERRGAEFLIHHAEILDKDGNFYTENLRDAKAEIRVVSDGSKRIYKPAFTFHGFRYIRLTGFNADEINPDNFKAIVVFSDMKRTGCFECGNELVNQLYQNIVWGLRGNFIDVPLDCPQRDERRGWTGDAQVFARTASIIYKTDKFFKKWLHDLAGDQRENGAITDVCPDHAGWESHGSAAWGDASVIVPYWIYRNYGDIQVINDQFDSMKKWILFMEKNGSERGLFDLHPYHWGDWLSLDAGDEVTGGFTDKNLIATAFLAYSNALFIRMGKLIGEDMSYFEELYDITIKRYREKYLNTGRIEHETQTANVLALYFGLTDKPEREAEKLVRDIEECGHLKTGFVGTPYLLHVLTDIGRVDLAYMLLLRKEFPSWLYPVTKGATTMWERWDGVKKDGTFATPDMNSFNHYAFGSIGDWLFTTVAGIESDFNEPAYKHIIFRPQPSKDMGYARAKILTDRGEIVSSWKYYDKECRFTFTVPEGSYATLYLNDDEHTLQAGTHKFVLNK